MYSMVKQFFKKNLPRFFRQARDIKDQIKIEINTLRQVGILKILKRFFCSQERWKKELPIQSVRRLNVNFQSLSDICKKYKNFKEGGHTYYFFPETLKDASLKKEFSPYIPSCAGLKIVKREGGIPAPYVVRDKTCRAQTFFSPKHNELLLVYNLFFNLNIGPRLYDVQEIQFQNGDVHVCYILEHIEGREPSKSACEEFLEKLKNLEAENLIKLINWNGYADMDFACPFCNGNLLLEKKSSSLKYVDLQNFALGNYYPYLKGIALEAAQASHFGQKSYLMGGNYLYQEIPGLNLSAKRSPSVRFEIFRSLLEESNLSIKDKLVLDVGCNMGLMGAQYLKAGAAWLHGFDFPRVIPSTEKILLSIGCTRFSLSGLLLGETVSLVTHLPSDLKENLDGCVISYLAIRGHVGWIQELGEIPWDFMLYEGHEGEDRADNLKFLENLNSLKKCYILGERWISDGNSLPRYVALLKSGTRES